MKSKDDQKCCSHHLRIPDGSQNEMMWRTPPVLQSSTCCAPAGWDLRCHLASLLNFLTGHRFKYVPSVFDYGKYLLLAWVKMSRRYFLTKNIEYSLTSMVLNPPPSPKRPCKEYIYTTNTKPLCYKNKRKKVNPTQLSGNMHIDSSVPSISL
jgi:hypothetical protein